MNQIVDTLIAALRTTRRGRAVNSLQSAATAPMVALHFADLKTVVGGAGDDTGPRGGWKAAAITVA